LGFPANFNVPDGFFPVQLRRPGNNPQYDLFNPEFGWKIHHCLDVARQMSGWPEPPYPATPCGNSRARSGSSNTAGPAQSTSPSADTRSTAPCSIGWLKVESPPGSRAMLFDLPLGKLKTYLPPRTDLPDFDDFWKRTLAAARQYPLKAVFTPMETGMKLLETLPSRPWKRRSSWNRFGVKIRIR
jgi:hypothetical protein